MHPSAPPATRPARQTGAYAIEFALAFVICFLLIYAILTYGLIFMAQQSMNRAANTGARALLTWAPDDAARVDAARQRIDTNIDWVAAMAGGGSMTIAVCLPGAGSSDPGGLCPAHPPVQQTAQVIVRYDYAGAPLVPTLGLGSLLSLPVPDTLQAQAQIDLGIAYPGTPEGS